MQQHMQQASSANMYRYCKDQQALLHVRIQETVATTICAIAHFVRFFFKYACTCTLRLTKLIEIQRETKRANQYCERAQTTQHNSTTSFA